MQGNSSGLHHLHKDPLWPLLDPRDYLLEIILADSTMVSFSFGNIYPPLRENTLWPLLDPWDYLLEITKADSTRGSFDFPIHIPPLRENTLWPLLDPRDYLLEIIMADSTMVICKFHHRRVHRASFLGNLNTYPTRDNCWNVCWICHSRNSIRVHRVRLAVKKKLTPNLLRPPTPHTR